MRLLLQLLFFLFPFAVSAQGPKGVPEIEQELPAYRPPLDIPLRLSGNFGELRPGHFHTGLDLKTYGRTGLKVKAIEEGYVSRIKVREGGYGKALYIDHPTGHTSVYAHLERFSPEIRSFLKEVQYQQERNLIDLYPRKGFLKVKKGEVVARAGNTGRSQAPHLHFEIRHTISEKPIDPMLLGFQVRDDRAPDLFGLRVLPRSEASSSERGTGNTYAVRSVGAGEYRLKRGGPLELEGANGFAIRVRDRVSTSYNPLGVRKVRVNVNDEPLFAFRFDTLDFSKKRYYNAHIDHSYLYHSGRRYHRCHRLPHNELPIYEGSEEQGWFTPEKDSLYRVRVEVSDRAGNRSTLRFKVRGKGSKGPNAGHTGSWERKPIKLERQGFFLRIPPDALYHEIDLKYSSDAIGGKGALSKTHTVHTPATPLHEPFQVRIALDTLPLGMREKLFIRSQDERWGSRLYKAEYVQGWAKAEVGRFGRLSVDLDSSAPSIRDLRIRDRISKNEEASFLFRVRDAESWIERYEARVDGKWRICYPSGSSDRVRVLVNDPERPLSPGKHELLFRVRDAAGNEREVKRGFVVEE